MKSEKIKIENIKIENIIPAGYNPRLDLKPGDAEYEKLKRSIKHFGYVDPIIYNKRSGRVVGGHQRLKVLLDLGHKEVDCVIVDMNEKDEKALNIALNKISGDWDKEKLVELLDDMLNEEADMTLTGFDDSEIQNLLEPIIDNIKNTHNKLTEKFIIPPLSVWDTKQGYWRDRKKQWLNMGIKSEVGRDAKAYKGEIGDKYGREAQNGTSIFDPVVCEVVYKWFCPDGGKVFDCFAGGSVRGIVADYLGYDYLGIELREEQVNANRENAKDLRLKPTWYCDDSLNMDEYIHDNSSDLLFSCPPYADLEVYSDDVRDISNMQYDEFCNVYSRIIKKACKKIKQDRFAVFVVGDVRDKNGNYRGFVDFTKQCFIQNGLTLYNDIVLLDMLGTSMIRCGKYFSSSRKLAKVHQNILVFYKGKIENIKLNFSDIDIDELNTFEVEDE